MPDWSRRETIQTAASALLAAWTRPLRGIAPPGRIMDGGPWIVNVLDRDLCSAARIADSWGRRGLRVVVGLGNPRRGPMAESQRAWSEVLQVLGWRHPMSGIPAEAHEITWYMVHPESRDGSIRLATYEGEHLLSGALAAIVDTDDIDLVNALVQYASSPWAGWIWVGSLYRRIRRPYRRSDLEDEQARVARLLGPRLFEALTRHRQRGLRWRARTARVGRAPWREE